MAAALRPPRGLHDGVCALRRAQDAREAGAMFDASTFFGVCGGNSAQKGAPATTAVLVSSSVLRTDVCASWSARLLHPGSDRAGARAAAVGQGKKSSLFRGQAVCFHEFKIAPPCFPDHFLAFSLSDIRIGDRDRDVGSAVLLKY